ncbi:MAG: hypothetical protein ACRCYY_18655 [Trueperaceae bacterium]
MALDAHLGKTIENHVWQFGINDKMHRTLFTNQYVVASQVSLLLRLNDYYEDCSFGTEELPQLKKEVDLLLSCYPEGHLMNDLLVKFSEVCASGIEDGLNLYFFCD